MSLDEDISERHEKTTLWLSDLATVIKNILDSVEPQLIKALPESPIKEKIVEAFVIALNDLRHNVKQTALEDRLRQLQENGGLDLWEEDYDMGLESLKHLKHIRNGVSVQALEKTVDFVQKEKGQLSSPPRKKKTKPSTPPDTFNIVRNDLSEPVSATYSATMTPINVDLPSLVIESVEIMSNVSEGVVENRKPGDRSGTVCTICNTTTQFPYQLRLHMRTHTGEKPYKCGECSASFAGRGDLSRHKRETHLKLKPFPCPLCPYRAARMFKLRKHQMSVHKNNMDLSKEALAGENMKEIIAPPAPLRNGMLPEVKAFRCDICSKEFARSVDLKRHLTMGSHSKRRVCEDDVNGTKRDSRGKSRTQCDVCGKVMLRTNLITHRRLHTGEKPFQCDICQQTFSQKRVMECHKSIHTGARPFMCDVCGKCFPLKDTLKAHKRIHTGEKPYECPVCKKLFRRKPNLRIHVAIHDGHKPHKCEFCGHCFTQRGDLKRHRQLHTKETPFRCERCQISFVRKDTLKKHLEEHHSKSKEIIPPTQAVLIHPDPNITLLPPATLSEPGPSIHLIFEATNDELSEGIPMLVSQPVQVSPVEFYSEFST